MLLILSPAKTLNFETKPNTEHTTLPLFAEQGSVLINILKKYSVDELMNLLAINRQLAILSHERIQTWSPKVVKGYSKQAVCAFVGEAYRGLNVLDWNDSDYLFAQSNLVILSAIYGVLRPFDLINPYRLEMETKLQNPAGANLYHFWEKTINQHINGLLARQKKPVLINLTSNEYYKSIVPKNIKAPIISPIFKDFKNGNYQVIVVYTKKARGSMARFAIKNQLDNPEDLKAFDTDGYLYNARLSKGTEWVYTRD